MNVRLKYIEVERASCPFHKGLIFAINVRLKFIEVEGASCHFK
jgi:hypothetical protein